MLADRIEVFSIYANHSHRHRIITALCQESSPSTQSLHPLLWRYLVLYLSSQNPRPYLLLFSFVLFSSSVCPSFFLFSPVPSFFPPLSLYLPLLYRWALWKTRCSVSRTRQQEFYMWWTLTHTHTHMVIGSMQANNRWLVIMGGELRKAHSRSLWKWIY